MKALHTIRSHFPTEASCLEKIVQLRWPEGFRCPRCGHAEAWVHQKRMIHECVSCRKKTSPTANTSLHRTHLSLREWFCAIHLYATEEKVPGPSELQALLGISSYGTAWSLSGRLKKLSAGLPKGSNPESSFERLLRRLLLQEA